MSSYRGFLDRGKMRRRHIVLSSAYWNSHYAILGMYRGIYQLSLLAVRDE